MAIRNRSSRIFKLLLLTYFFAAPALAVPTISNVSDWNGADAFIPINNDSNFVFGQVFTPSGPETRLDDFTMYVGLQGGETNPMQFRTYVQEFDITNLSTVGSILFSSSDTTVTTNDLNPFNFVTGLNLTAGTNYLAYLSAAGTTPAGGGTAAVGGIIGSATNTADLPFGGVYSFLPRVADPTIPGLRFRLRASPTVSSS